MEGGSAVTDFSMRAPSRPLLVSRANTSKPRMAAAPVPFAFPLAVGKAEGFPKADESERIGEIENAQGAGRVIDARETFAGGIDADGGDVAGDEGGGDGVEQRGPAVVGVELDAEKAWRR